MKKIYIIGLSLFLMGFGGFIEGLEDLPIAPNWQQKQSETISFGNNQTNFVEVYLESENESFENLISFYKKTLPQLGWKFDEKKESKYYFSRENETLKIENTQKNARITLKSSN